MPVYISIPLMIIKVGNPTVLNTAEDKENIFSVVISLAMGPSYSNSGFSKSGFAVVIHRVWRGIVLPVVTLKAAKKLDEALAEESFRAENCRLLVLLERAKSIGITCDGRSSFVWLLMEILEINLSVMAACLCCIKGKGDVQEV